MSDFRTLWLSLKIRCPCCKHKFWRIVIALLFHLTLYNTHPSLPLPAPFSFKWVLLHLIFTIFYKKYIYIYLFIWAIELTLGRAGNLLHDPLTSRVSGLGWRRFNKFEPNNKAWTCYRQWIHATNITQDCLYRIWVEPIWAQLKLDTSWPFPGLIFFFLMGGWGGGAIAPL